MIDAGYNRRGSLAAKLGVLPEVTCPHCWNTFPPEKFLWVSQHEDLVGDPKLGPEEQQRFVPTRFNVKGAAIDSKGLPTQHLACPECHLSIPRALLEMPPLFLSVFGAPGSGKSFYLAAMSWELRNHLSLKFGVNFSDPDPTFNFKLNSYEEQLFQNQSPDQLVPMNQLIAKTDAETDREHYNTVTYDSHRVTYLQPFLFAMRPLPGHPNVKTKNSRPLSRSVCLYDNAGEDFQPGRDSANRAVTRHLAKASVLMFTFDPTQDVRWRQHCKNVGRHRDGASTMRQEPTLQEAATRIRRYAGLRTDGTTKQPLIVIATKFDSWSHLLGGVDLEEPWRKLKRSDGVTQDIYGLELAKIQERSRRTRELFLRLTPEVVTAAEGISEEVLYIPVSAVGWRVEVRASDQMEVVRPMDTIPYWVTIPYLYALSRACPGLIPIVK